MKIQKRHIVLAALILALGAAVYLNWQFSGTDTSVLKSVSKELGSATYVNADTATKDQVMSVSKTTTEADNYFAKASLEREQTQDKAIDVAKEVLNSSEITDEAKTIAAKQLSELENSILIQGNIESIIKGKGMTQCLCFISDSGCSVAVLKSEMQKNSPLIIKDAVQSQLTIDFNKITIIEV